MSLATQLIKTTRGIIAGSDHFFDELYSTWDFLSGDDRVCHSRTAALLAHAAWKLPSKPAVELENCFTIGAMPHPHKKGRQKAIKWHPDLVLREHTGSKSLGKILLFVDFESPNSSDFRVIDRDISHWYLNWIASGHDAVEYLIITSLPDKPSPDWLCRYSKSDGYKKSEARKSPFRYWYGVYRSKLKPKWRKYPIKFANFFGKHLKAVDMAAKSS